MITVVIALLAIIGVDLIVIVVFLAGVLGRRRWVGRQLGAFRGTAQVVDGQVPHLGSKARTGYGRWVRDVLVWTPAPFFLRNAFVAVDTIQGTHNPTGKVRRLGDHPRVITLAANDARIDITVRAEDVVLVTTAFPGIEFIRTAPPPGTGAPDPTTTA